MNTLLPSKTTTAFALNDEQMEAFTRLLEAPVDNEAAVKKLLQRRSVWDSEPPMPQEQAT